MADDEAQEAAMEEEARKIREMADEARKAERAQAASEARLAMEEAQKARLAKQMEELAEYQESRKEAKAKEDEEIQALRDKRIQRQKEREEEEKRQAEYRAAEEVRRKAEEATKQEAKREAEAKLKEELEEKRKLAEERMKPKGRSFKITKKSDSEKLDSVMSKEEMQKSKEQLEEEKQAILSQRIQPLVIEGLAADKLVEKAKELNDQIRRLEGDKYDLEQRFKRQQYDMIELAERARQMNKGKGKRSTVQVDESFDRLADKFTSAPPKIQLCSKYERHTDHRSYGERMTLFEELSKEKPAPKINRVGDKQAEEEPAAEEAGEGEEE